ncbi:glutamate formiminotransferase [Actinomarinicola tropica]|uniref:glutamate formimidoyltransferase n=1 Tax=Actinomarinicola tropica TaxID=2789776 RepID=A0A5Q2RHY0_9ACTN|nr:glutamate formiminotransferase [Actinomarinicola tropica]QGG93956.1 glutamate formiminotransferase [Actinomarinicola tropica]
MIECVVNVSEGRDAATLDALADSAGDALLDLHRDPHHHRSVLTLAGVDAVRAVARVAVGRIDLTRHDGVHPRIGAVDVVPFVALGRTPSADALAARDDYARWSATELAVPCLLYGPERTLPDVRRAAFAGLLPDHGPDTPHPTAGATAVGARPILVAYNVWLVEPDLSLARRIAREIRRPGLRSLGLQVGDRVQVSMNLVAPDDIGPGVAYDAVAARVPVAGAELVGLVPRRVLLAEPRHRWAELDLAEDRTIEARLDRAGWPWTDRSRR